MKIVRPNVELLWVTKNPESIIELSGRTAYKSEDLISKDSSKKFIKKIYRSGHHSVLEHASASFKIVTDRGITHEIVRHRLASYTQESTRYCNYSANKFNSEISVIEPPNLTISMRNQWLQACEFAEASYFNLLQLGVSPQIARSVLPTCTKAEIIMTCNFREWLHFISLRSSSDAHPQIQPIALAILRELAGYAPSVFGDLADELLH